eukprot:s2776_g15.t1
MPSAPEAPSTPADDSNRTSGVNEPASVFPAGAAMPDRPQDDKVQRILADLRSWSSLPIPVAELAQKITSSGWKSDLHHILFESVVMLVGPPNAGKTSLATNIAKALSLKRIRTSSKLFWMHVADAYPFMAFRHYCNDSVHQQDGTFEFEKFVQSYSTIMKEDDFRQSLDTECALAMNCKTTSQRAYIFPPQKNICRNAKHYQKASLSTEIGLLPFCRILALTCTNQIWQSFWQICHLQRWFAKRLRN